MKPDWFPDWEGKVCAIIASGPSTKKVDISALRGRAVVLAIKENGYELCPWADVIYGCDAAWWNHRIGLQAYKGLKVAWSGAHLRFTDIKRVEIDKSQDKIYPVERRQYRMLFDRPGHIGSGGNSGYQALNLAVQFGAKRVLLVGFDMTGRSGVHWYGRNNWELSGNPDESCFVRWRAAFDVAAVDLAARGVEVINTSPMSALTCFSRGTVEGALQGWGV